MSQHTTKRKNEITHKKQQPKPAEEKEEVVDLSVSDSEGEDTEKKAKVEEGKVKVSASDRETVKSYRRMLEESADRFDEINEGLLPLLFNKVSVVRGKPLEWQEEVTVIYLDDPDSELLLRQCQLQLLKSKFFFTDKADSKWIEVVVVADPVHCQLRLLSRMMHDPEHALKQESQVALPPDSASASREQWDAVCLAVEEAFEEIFEDIYCEEEEEEEEQEETKTPVKKAKPATQPQVPSKSKTAPRIIEESDDEDSDEDSDDDEPMPPIKAKAVSKKGKVPDDLVIIIGGILDKGLFRRNDYGDFLMTLRSAFNDDKAWEDMLANHSDPQYDNNNALYECRRIWARLFKGQSPATDKKLLEMVRQYNVACVELQAKRLDCIEEIKAMIPRIKQLNELCSSVYWNRHWKLLANSILNFDNLCSSIALGSSCTWKEVREVLEDHVLAAGQALPPLDSTIVYNDSEELEPMKKAWKPIEARISASGFASAIL